MKRILKIVAGLFGVLVAIIVLIVMGAVGYAYSTVPPLRGAHTVEGISSEVVIRFDVAARPYLRAETLEDALFAQGWLHAQHRLWQMDMFRRAGRARLSALLGASMIESDKELWRYGVPQMAKKIEENASDDMRRYVDAYVAGVNAAMTSGTFDVPEYVLLQASPEPWTPSDVYALGAVMAFQSANNAGRELLRLSLLQEVGEERARVFLDHDWDLDDFPYVLTAETSSVVSALERLKYLDTETQPLMPSFALGSNGWVVAPSKSASGKALFAFDSHDDFGVPNLFYEVHMFFGEGREIRGWSVAGLPGVINGFNERIAWGFTNIGDTQDLYIETRDPENPVRFRDGDTWYEATKETVEIAVSGRDAPERFDVYYTKNGNLISDDPPISLRWTVQDIGDMGIDSILEYNLAQNWDEYCAALDGLAAPSLNATYADIDGNIGFRTGGLLPIRRTGKGLVPLDGSDPSHRWDGYVPSDQMPERLNGDEGFFAAANARVSRDGDEAFVSADNAPGYRIRRIKDVLMSRDDLTVDDMRALQLDWFDGQADLLWPSLKPATDGAWDSGLYGEAYAALSEWITNPVASPDSGAALLFQAWYRAIAVEVFKPELSEDVFAQLYRNNYALNNALDHIILRDVGSTWWRADREGIIRTAFENAVDEIAAVQGSDVSQWRLDAMHAVVLAHELGKAVPELGAIFNADPAPWGGGASTVGRARYRYDRAYDATAGATVRVIGEMSKPKPRMEAIIPGGQSGHPLSKNYLDQFDAWLAGETSPIAPTPDDVLGTTYTLRPAGN